MFRALQFIIPVFYNSLALRQMNDNKFESFFYKGLS